MKHLTLLFILFTGLLSAQHSIEGTIKNEQGENLILASVFLVDSPFASVSDEFGQYTIKNIEPGEYLMKATYLGYKSFEDTIMVSANMKIDIVLQGSKYALEDVEITANNLDTESPFSYTEVDEERLNTKNLGQDIPVLMEHLPNMVSTSDAGAGIGYTAMRVRGSDATRINVTVNGVPINDSESHGLFWVNMPDFATSVNKIQVQRGVGPSTNGAGAFGATVAMHTNDISENPLVSIGGSYGSFNTKRVSVSVTTGLINDQWNIEGRYSLIKSDGYVDRASSDLSSYYFAVTHLNENSSLRFITFSGKEKTYQSWWGVPESRLNGDQEALQAHYDRNRGSIYQTTQDSINLFDSDRRYNYYLYDNQVDDYRQDHYQLIWARSYSDNYQLNLTAHYTKGLGFFEEYKTDEDCAFYGLQGCVNDDGEAITSDIVRRRWLDNHFFGLIANNKIKINDSQDMLLGLSANRYVGDHYGVVVWSDVVSLTFPNTIEYYRSDATKSDYNAYLKYNLNLSDRIELFADVQNRIIVYDSEGIDNDQTAIDIDTSYNFLNPKLGLNYKLDDQKSVYLSVSKAQREPVRSDFIDAVGTRVPKHESLMDYEAGFRLNNARTSLNANLYYMDYTDQLVVTGAVNDVGAAVRTNVDKSYRMGLELEATHQVNSDWQVSANLALSQNKIKEFTEVIVDYGTGAEVRNNYTDSDIAFSPNLVGGAIISYSPRPDIDIQWLSKFVGRQYLDNTSNNNKAIDPYFVNDLVIKYAPALRGISRSEVKLLVNNLLNSKFVSNGYTYSYIFDDLIEENFFYPQAGINVLLGMDFSF